MFRQGGLLVGLKTALVGNSSWVANSLFKKRKTKVGTDSKKRDDSKRRPENVTRVTKLHARSMKNSYLIIRDQPRAICGETSTQPYVYGKFSYGYVTDAWPWNDFSFILEKFGKRVLGALTLRDGK